MNLLEAQKVARETMDEHGLQDWTFEFDNAKRRFGVTRYSTKTISLSRGLTELNNPMQVIDTILHEIAHALTEHDRGHGTAWKRTAKSIGCNGSRTYDQTVAKPKARYTASCSNCGSSTQRHRKPNFQIACARCCNEFNGGRFDPQYIMKFKEN